MPLPAEADAGQPPTLSAQPSAAEEETRPLGTLAQEFKRVVSARHPLGRKHVGVAQLSRTILVLFSGPYERADGLVTFLRRLGLRVIALDNDARTGGMPRMISCETKFSSTFSTLHRVGSSWASSPPRRAALSL